MSLQRKRLSSGLSVTQKVFVRSRNGSALKIVREHYLRDDIPCYSRACEKCLLILKPDANGELPVMILSETPLKLVAGDRHYVVLDTNIILHAMDLVELTECFFDVIVPQTVLEEVKNRSFPIYQRLRALVKAADKRFVIYHNEFSEYTHVSRGKGESSNDFNDRAIRKVASYYSEHLAPQNIKVFFVSNDKDNLSKAQTEGILAVTLPQYVELLPNADSLRDKIPTGDQNYDGPQETSFPEYYSTSRVLGGVRNGTLYQGSLNVLGYNVLEGTVLVAAFKKPLLILGSRNLNRAFNGDAVVVELLPKDKWREPLSTIVEEEVDMDTNDNPEDAGDELVISDKERRLLAQDAIANPAKLQPTARVVAIHRRSWRFYVGQIAPSSVGDIDSSGTAAQLVYVVLMDRLLPKIRIRTRQARQLLGQRIVVAVDSWPLTSKYPQGHFVRSLGDIETAEAETEALLLEHSVEYRPFSKAVLECLPSEGDKWVVPAEIPKNRRDFRDKLVCLIDPPGCVDIDDALHAQKLPNGNYEVGVHIADVTHFVKAGTALDNEGASRGTSVYLVDKRIDMLPMLLGTNLCSLQPYVERYAFSVIWELDENANIILVEYTKSVIKLKEAFLYEAAQKRIDDALQQDELTNSIRILMKLSKKLKQKRIDAGALNLASPEVKVYMDLETLDPGEVEIKKLLDTNSLVEEFMLFANISVARKIYDSYPQTAMLRRHAPPPATNFEELNEQLAVRKPDLNMNVSLSSLKALADSLDRCEDPNDPYFNTLLRIMSTRCMMAAEYFPSGAYGYPEFRHYGLAVDIYTHFTSPIRRYCDVVVHRQLAGAIGYEDLDLSHRDKNKMELVTKNINRRHRNAQFAGRASIEYYVGQVMKNNELEQEGYVIKCFNNGIVVLVPKFGVESLIKIEQMGTEEEFDEDKFELSFKDLNGKPRRVGVFDKVKVDVRSVKDDVTGKRKAQLVLK